MKYVACEFLKNVQQQPGQFVTFIIFSAVFGRSVRPIDEKEM